MQCSRTIWTKERGIERNVDKMLAFYDMVQCRLVHREIQEERTKFGVKNVLQFKMIFENPAPAVRFATRARSLRFVYLSRTPRFLTQAAAASKMRRSGSSSVFTFFCYLRSSCNPTNKNLTELGTEILVAKEWDHSGRSIDKFR
jgi:hypothetical protein